VPFSPVFLRPVAACCVLACLLGTVGCQSPRGAIACGAFTPAWDAVCQKPVDSSRLEAAQDAYDRACDAQRDDDPRTPDYYYEAAILSWRALCGDLEPPASCTLVPRTPWQLYHASLSGLIREGQQRQRFKCGELSVRSFGKQLVIPVACLGLPWQPSDVHAIKLAELPRKSQLSKYHAQDGFGVPVIALRFAGKSATGIEQFYPAQGAFAATVVLRPAGDDSSREGGVLEFYGPLNISQAEVYGESVTLARDISAPFDYRLKNDDHDGLLGFLDPGQTEVAEGLRFLEPYQPGKIPVVFIHGLLSDPSTWFDAANDLRTQAWFNQHYQIWGFSYPTGKPFLTSAARFREQCRQAVALLDPECQDPALQQMVLVGHSMGGLVSKLQITHSENRVWDSFASIPLEQVRASGIIRSELAERCFFDPQPFVTRVVFIATPHRGSSWAARGVGKISSALVEPSPQMEALHDELVTNNPGAFSPTFERGIPTSIEMLEPNNDTLQAIDRLRIHKRVTMHSIIGTARPTLANGPGDGVVAVTAARQAGVVSERYVNATHTTILRHPDTHDEIRHILREHLRASDLGLDR